MELETAASTIEVSDSGIVIRWSDGSRSRFHSLWLRDNCQTAVTVTELNPDVWVMDAFRNDDGDLEIEFSDGHETTFSFDWIRSQSHEAHDRRGRPRVISPIRAGHELDSFQLPTPGSALHCDLLESVSEFGAAIVDGVDDLGSLVGPLVEIEQLAEDESSLVPRTHEPFRYVPPALLFIQPSGAVDVIVVDGFGIAIDLHEEDPDVFDMLVETSIGFRSIEEDSHLVAYGPIISLDRDYEVSGVRFDEDAIAPLDLDPGMVGEFYRSLITFGEQVNNPARAILQHLEPGEVLVLDNHRMLHGMTGLTGLRRAAISRDVFHGQLRQLRKTFERPNVDERLPSGPRP